MRILLINSEYPPIGGGAGNATANLAREFASMGEDVTVLTTSFDGFPKKTWVEAVENCGYTLQRAPSLRRKKEKSGAMEQGLFVLGSSWESLQIARRWKPDVTLAFFGVPSGPAGLLLKVFHGVPCVVSLRGGDVPGFRPYDFALYHRLIAPLVKFIWKKADAVVANSTGLKALANTFEPDSAIRIIPNGVNVKQFASIAEADRSWQPPKMLFAGRVVYQKGLDVVLHALGSLAHLEWDLTIAGDGPYKPFLQSLAVEQGIMDRVHFTGWLDKDAMLEQYRQANVFVFASRHEGMPNAVLEAMASGLPVVASRIAGNEELVVPGETGFLVPGEDVTALRSALEKILEDANLRQRMGLAARQRVETQFTWRAVAESYRQLFMDILKS
ncbi:MAG: glycosyltransferase family 4 protein [Chloroflexota bacterium]